MAEVVEINTKVKELPELSDATIEEIHEGLIVPSQAAIVSMAREIRKWRGVKNPDSV